MHGLGIRFMIRALDEARRSDEAVARPKPPITDPELASTAAEADTRVARWRAWARRGPGLEHATDATLRIDARQPG